MKICYLNHDLHENTGAGRFCLSLVSAIQKQLPNYDYRVLTHNKELPTGILGWLLAVPRLRKIFKKSDIIHALDAWPYGVMAMLAGWGLNKKVIITAIGTGAVQPLYQPVKKRLLTWAYRKADVLTTVSNNTKREVLKLIPDLNIEVINHGVDAEKFQMTNSIRQPAGQNLKPYVLSVGALKKRKGYEYSIAAFAEVASRFPDLKYVIVGSGPEKKNLESRIKNLELKDKVVFLENLGQESLVALYQNAELFILLPQDDNHDIEGFGLVFLEAAAAGLSVIGTKESGAADAVLNSKNGFLVSPHDYHQAAEAIVRILSDKRLKESFSRASVEFAKEMSWERAASKYLTVYGTTG